MAYPRYDFSKFLAEYEACHMNYVRMKFAEADDMTGLATSIDTHDGEILFTVILIL